jgi:hypothetical protein
MGFGGLGDGGRAFGGFDLMPFSGSRIVEGVPWLSAPLDDQAAAVGLLEPLAFALQEPDEDMLVQGDDLVQLFGGCAIQPHEVEPLA